jgi:hypothetical protein
VSEPQWLMRIESGLSAHFKQPDGTSRPGTDWLVGLKRGDEEYKVRVRALLSDDATPATRKDQTYQAQTVFGYLSDLLAQGWTPDKGGDLQITILNPKDTNATETHAPEAKPWWRFW